MTCSICTNCSPATTGTCSDATDGRQSRNGRRRAQVIEDTRFAHASEAELARILDYYGVSWEYEPRTFPIMWSLDGKVVESFSPDFYLPDLNIYVELTTLKQSLVRRKNRKLRRLRELYPDIRVKLFYGKDFRALMLKYGRFDLAASLSGLEGQVAADRANSQVKLTLVVPPPANRRRGAPGGFFTEGR